jgi:hypothetical protein
MYTLFKFSLVAVCTGKFSLFTGWHDYTFGPRHLGMEKLKLHTGEINWSRKTCQGNIGHMTCPELISIVSI